MKDIRNTITTLSIGTFWDFYDKMTEQEYILCSYGARKMGKYITHFGNYRKLKNDQK